jgi:DNA-binding response OmpR family regulator
MSKRILVIEDEVDIARLVALHLEDAGYEAVVSTDGLEAWEQVTRRRWDLIVLDLALPGIDGLEICRRLRAIRDVTPILMLTSRSSEVDRVLGLELGADDYVTKPFSIRELVARVKANLRRVESMAGHREPPEEIIEQGNLSIDLARRRVVFAGREVQLTAKEFNLLVHFARRPGRVYTRSDLLDQVWGYGHEGYEHTVNTHINRLRGKLERDPANPELILTVWGVGYKFRDCSRDPHDQPIAAHEGRRA